jgi:ketosteroid isomerase-like protein
MKNFLLAALVLIGLNGLAQSKDETAVRKLLADQVTAWNRGDIESFMQGYWHSDSLMFIGSKGVTYGFDNTWERYKKTYDSREKMGILAFDLLHVFPLAGDVYMVVGKWHLTRTVGDIGGHYTLILKKIEGKWVIISDHTS